MMMTGMVTCMMNKQTAKRWTIIAFKYSAIFAIRLVITMFDTLYRLGQWVGPRLQRGTANLINLMRKVNRPHGSEATITAEPE